MAFLIVFHHESESGAWLISTYRSACAAPAVIRAASAAAFINSFNRGVFMVLSPEFCCLVDTGRGATRRDSEILGVAPCGCKFFSIYLYSGKPVSNPESAFLYLPA